MRKRPGRPRWRSSQHEDGWEGVVEGEVVVVHEADMENLLQ